MHRILVGIAMVAFAAPALAGEPRACFTPEEDCAAVVANEIATAQREVLVEASSFTAPAIAEALVKAKQRGVDVRAVLETRKVYLCSRRGLSQADDNPQRTEASSGADLLLNNGIPVLVDTAHPVSHNKAIIIDGKTVITGSYSYTKAGQEKNAGNVIVFTDPAFAAKFVTNWRQHAEHTEPFSAPAQR